MSRSYLAFGSDDKMNWSQLRTVVASGATQALNLARDQEDHRHYAVVPARNWTPATPSVRERPAVVEWEKISPDQMQIEDPAAGEIREAIAEAKEAITGPREREEVA